MCAPTLLGLPVTQCGHAEIHAPYLSLSIKKGSSERASKPVVEPTMLAG